MPFVKRSVEPVNLRKGALKNPSDITLGEEHEVIVNKSFSQILLQLSQLSTHANEIFSELAIECKGIIDKSQKLKTRVWELDRKCRDLNVLEVPLPEGTLEEVATEVRNSKLVQTNQETGFFTSVTRPSCVQKLYNQAKITPRAVYASLGPAGFKAAKRFCLTPVFKKYEDTTVLLAKHERVEYRIKQERGDKLRQPRPRSSASVLELKASHLGSLLPTPEESTLKTAKSQPSVLIQIDTSESNFERFAQSRASLRNIQNRLSYTPSGSDDVTAYINRGEARRQTIGGLNDLRRVKTSKQSCPTSHTLDLRIRHDSKPKNPDHYLEDRVISTPERSARSKEKRPSLLTKLVRRSRSLPRDMGRLKSKTELIVPPDYYDIHPKKSVIVQQTGAILDDKSKKCYTNFYGAPNTELPSPQLNAKLKKSKSDHQISDQKHRTKSQSQMEEIKLAVLRKKRPRSVSAERGRCTSASQSSDHKRSSSLTRTFSGLFRRRSKNVNTTESQSRDSLNTVFTSTSEGEAGKRHSKRLSITNVTLRKRDSKATNSSSGRWSGSERFSMDSDGLLGSALSQNRLSRVSADKDSALGVDISERSEREMNYAEKLPSNAQVETNSIYSVDQDGFYTTMHTDSRLQKAESEQSLELYLNKETLSSSTSTKTLNSISHVPSCDYYVETDELSQRVKSKVEASNNINRYSIVAALSDHEESPEPVVQFKTSTKRERRTYETNLDQAFENMSDIETSTFCSDTDSVISLQVHGRKQPTPPERRQSLKTNTPCGATNRSEKKDLDGKHSNTFLTNAQLSNTKLTKYQQITGCAQYMKLTPTSLDDNSQKSCHSLPRNFSRNNLTVAHTVSDASSPDNTGSWPRQLSKPGSNVIANSPEAQSIPDDNIPAKNTGPVKKRQSLSPNRSESSDRKEIISNLIEEARRMSLTPKDASSSGNMNPIIRRPNCPRPWSLHSKLNSCVDHNDSPTTVSPYASSNVVKEETFMRQPSYRMACEPPSSHQVSRSTSAELGRMQRAASYRKASQRPILTKSYSSYETGSPKATDSSPTSPTSRHSFQRAPSYRKAQSVLTDRISRAPSYRRATRNFPTNGLDCSMVREADSGLSSAASSMTTSYNSNTSESSMGSSNRVSSYRLATDDSPSASINPVPLHNGLIRECMKGVYANTENHLKSTVTVPTELETVQIRKKTDSFHYSVPKIPPTPTSFNPSKDASSYKSRPAKGPTLTPPPRKSRPMSSYTPTETERSCDVPENILQSRKTDTSAFTSMELLRNDEMAVLTVLDKVRRSTRPLSLIQSDV